MDTASRLEHRRAIPLLRLGLVAFVLAWLLDWFALQSVVPIWFPFLIALGLELQFFLRARRLESDRTRRRDRSPQAVDRERYGFAAETDDLALVRDGDDELWIPYSGETGADLDDLIAEARAQAEEAPTATRAVADRRPRRPLGQLLVGAAVLTALAALVWVVESNRGWRGLDAETRAEAAARFSAEASHVAGHAVTIRCDDTGEYVGAVQHSDGVATVGGRLAYLTPERCHDLYRLAFKGEVTFSQTARALAVLAHEAWHLRGLREEGATECYALQSAVDLGQRFGLSEATARQMMRQQLVENALRRGASSEYLVPPECRDGGSLDRNPGSSQFP